MEEILRELGMGELVEVFKQNEVGPSECLNISDDDFVQLGISTIGKKTKLRNRCKLYLEAASEDSPALRRLRMLQAARRRGAPSARSTDNSNPPKQTRRISVGWLHRSSSVGGFVRLSHAKGGGTHRMDLSKQLDHSELTKQIVDFFFPSGRSTIQNLCKEEISCYLATFTGEQISNTLRNGEPFTVEGYYRQVAVSPLRIYLHTSVRAPQATPMESENPSVAATESDEAEDTLPDLHVTSTGTNAPVTSFDRTGLPNPRLRLSLTRRQRNRMTGVLSNRIPAAGREADTIDLTASAIGRQEEARSLSSDTATESTTPDGCQSMDTQVSAPGGSVSNATEISAPDVSSNGGSTSTESLVAAPDRSRFNEALSNVTSPGESRPDVTPTPGGSRPDVTPAPGGSRPDVTPAPGESRPDVAPTPGGSRPDVTPAPGESRPDVTPTPGGSRSNGAETSVPDSQLSDDEDFISAGSSEVFFRVVNNDVGDSTDSTPQSVELLEAFESLNSSLRGRKEITVNRNNILEDVLRIYGDPEIPTRNLLVKFRGESGQDYGGLTKDFLTSAWRDIVKSFFDGEDAVIPNLPLHRQRREKDSFVAIGRFISHWAALMGTLPPRLSRTSILGMVFVEDPVSDAILLEDFMFYLAPSDRSLVKRSLRHFDILSQKQRSDLLDFFSIHQLQEIPKQDRIEQQILCIAQDVLIDKPAPLLKKMKQGTPVEHIHRFWALLTTKGVDHIFQKQRPTGKKVASVISTGDHVLRPDEERALYYFKQFVQELDQDDLSALLQFTTGSTLMPDMLVVSFRNVTGETRCPIAHTCSNVLELPCTYTSLQDLKREFRAVLSCEHSFEMSIL